MKLSTLSLLSIFVVANLTLQGCSAVPSGSQTATEHAQESTHDHHGKPDKTAHTHSHEAGPITWKLSLPEAPLQAGQSTRLAWQLTDTANQLPIRNLEKTHEKLSHFIAVSQDLNSFQHLHPDVTGPGTMAVEALFPRNGRYVLFLQVKTPEQGEQTLRQTLTVGKTDAMKPARLVPDNDHAKQVDGYTFTIKDLPTVAGKAGVFSIAVEKDGKPVTDIAPYLGAGGHVVILSEDGEHFLHVHPMTESTNGLYASPIMFHTEISEPGRYRLWAQMKLNGSVKTVSFTFKVDD